MAQPAPQNENTREKLCLCRKSSRLPSGSGPPIVTFYEFRKVKENDRQGQFKNKAPKKRKVDENKDSATAKVVTIKVGLIEKIQELQNQLEDHFLQYQSLFQVIQTM